MRFTKRQDARSSSSKRRGGEVDSSQGVDDEEERQRKRQRTLDVDSDEAEEEEGNGANDEENAAAAAAVPVELPDLPPEIWAMIITDNVPYEDVMNFSATCTLFLHEVLPLVPRLFFTRAGELHASQARRFENGCVQEIKIFSYITYEQYQAGDGTQRWRQKLCEETAQRVSFFLTRFPQLKALFIGGVKRGRRLVMNGRHVAHDEYKYEDVASSYDFARFGQFEYKENTAVEDSKSKSEFTSDGATTQEEDIHRHLTRSFCGAFQAGTLLNSAGSNARIHGVSGTYGCYRDRAHQRCNGLCRMIFQTFPLRHLFMLSKDVESLSTQTCLSVKDRFAIIAKRPGGRDFLRDPERLGSVTGWSSRHLSTGVSFYNDDTLNTMKEMVTTYGCDMTEITHEKLVKHLPPRDAPFKEASLRELKAIGFQVPDDYFTNLV